MAGSRLRSELPRQTNTMSESFADLFEESLNTIEMAPGSIVTGTVVDIDDDWVVVHAGLKSEGVIPKNQFLNEEGVCTLTIGDQVKVAMEVVDDGFGETRLSREKARRAESWEKLEEASEQGEVVIGIINGKVKGGFTVDVNDIRAFLPGSLVDIRPLRETAHLEGKPLEFKVIKLDQKRNNVVVSRRAVLEEENSHEREELLASMQEGQDVKGIVKNLTDYGAFVDLGGVDGLLHITDMAWKRIRHPSEMVNVGDEVDVRILKFDRETITGTIKSITDFGIFIGLEGGIDGLVHLSDISWNEPGETAVRRYSKGEQIETIILSVDPERERISLGIKQMEKDPFSDYAAEHDRGDIVKGTVIEVQPKEAIIELSEDVTGLLKAVEISIDRVEDARNVLKEGEELEVKIINMDRKNRTIGLSIKAKDMEEERQAVKDHQKQESDRSGPATLGDLIKAQMNKPEDD